MFMMALGSKLRKVLLKLVASCELSLMALASVSESRTRMVVELAKVIAVEESSAR